ncbi:MAG: N-acetylmuramoyl-L-alanine amidase [Proteobacteria bacterium]|nr:N-acetylmuramoyl-L-alanine amidase [Pseudomonadota bacterium]
MRRWLQILALFIAPVAVFAAMIGVDRLFGAPGRGRAYVVDVDLPPVGEARGLPPIAGPQDGSRPLVVIDAGHGGKDPGAGTGALKEKDVTLALAQALRAQLLKLGGIRVAMTRDEDRFLVLAERSAIARKLDADLFISIHADSTGDNAEANGASVYTLSDKGSSEAASRFAARENAADVINGVNLGKQSDAVSSILVDLSQRDSLAHSQEFANLILREGAGKMPFRERSEQSAAFAVLKAPDIPSVLFETGYISNNADAARLGSPAGQATFAEITARAIRAFFARTRNLPAANDPGFRY